MTNEDYFKYMDNPLSDEEKQTLIDKGWKFANENYIYIPDDYDGCMASGIHQIRRILLEIQHHDIYWKYNGKCKDVLEGLT
jgi:hypothetical protein